MEGLSSIQHYKINNFTTLCEIAYSLLFQRCFLIRVIENDVAERFHTDIETAVVDVKVRRVMSRGCLWIFSRRHSSDKEKEGRRLGAKKRKVLCTGRPLGFGDILVTGRFL